MTGPHRSEKRSGQFRSDVGKDFHRSTPHRNEPSTTGTARSTGRMPCRRHPRRDQARQARPVATGRKGHPRRPHQARSEAQPWRVRPRPNRPGRPTSVQRACDGRRIRSRPHPSSLPGRHAGRESERPAAWETAQASKAQEAHLVSVHRAGTHTTTEIAELFGVARSTVYRAINGAGATAS